MVLCLRVTFLRTTGPSKNCELNDDSRHMSSTAAAVRAQYNRTETTGHRSHRSVPIELGEA
jgi:hypothetical protein